MERKRQRNRERRIYTSEMKTDRIKKAMNKNERN
jgi:hypothetical protein